MCARGRERREGRVVCSEVNILLLVPKVLLRNFHLRSRKTQLPREAEARSSRSVDEDARGVAQAPCSLRGQKRTRVPQH